MLLKVGGHELEIILGKFVCFGQDEGETSYFSEWEYLDPKLREKFENIRKQLLQVMGNFINSEDNAAFKASSEAYRETQTGCCSPRT